MLATAWFRKRLYLGIAMALYGLSVFNLHFWGFGVPFILVGAWYLVRAYRLQQKLKLARAEAPSPGRSGASAPPPATSGTRPRTPPPRPPPKPKPGTSAKPAEGRPERSPGRGASGSRRPGRVALPRVRCGLPGLSRLLTAWAAAPQFTRW